MRRTFPILAVVLTAAVLAPANAPRARAETALEAAIAAQRAPAGSIYVATTGGSDIAEALAARLGPLLRRHLSAFVLAMQVPEPAVRILELPAGVPPPPPRALVAPLDALAVVTLRAEAAPSRGRPSRSMWLAIEFAPIPGLPARFEAAASSGATDGAIALAEFERSLGPRWTRHAVLGIAAREFALLGEAAAPPRLRALQHFLSQEARQAPATDPDAVALQALRDAIDRSPRLGGRR